MSEKPQTYYFSATVLGYFIGRFVPPPWDGPGIVVLLVCLLYVLDKLAAIKAKRGGRS